MPHQALAVLCRELDRPVVVETILIDPPRRGEALVKIAACGVCHSDLSATNGTIQMKLPLVLGHEAAGVVAEVGEGITELAPGDHVISSFVNMCGKCRWCTTGKPHLCDMAGKTLYTLPDGTTPARDAAGNPLSVFSACGVMAEYATLSIDNLVKIDNDIPLDRAALVSCGVMTGVGAVFNTAKVEPGTAVMVIGAGGVGLNVIQGAAIAGAEPDRGGRRRRRQARARARVRRDARDQRGEGRERRQDREEADRRRSGLLPSNASASRRRSSRRYRSLRKGGKAVVVGVTRGDESVAIKPVALTFEEKTLTGSYFGSARPREDFPRLIGLYRAGRAQARRTDHASLPRRRGAAGVRRSGRRQERAGRDRVRVSAVAEAPNPLAWLSS